MNKHLIKALIGIFILTVSVKLNAQKPAFETGKHIPPPEAKKKKNRYSRLYASTNDEFFVSDRIKDGSVVTTYNPLTLKKEGTFTLKNPEVNGHDANWFKRYFNASDI